MLACTQRAIAQHRNQMKYKHKMCTIDPYSMSWGTSSSLTKSTWSNQQSLTQWSVQQSVHIPSINVHTTWPFTYRDRADWLNCVPSTPPIRVDNSKRSNGKEDSVLIQTYILVRNKGSYPHRKSITVSRKCIPHQHCFQLKLTYTSGQPSMGVRLGILQVQVFRTSSESRLSILGFSFSHSFVEKMEGRLGRDFSHDTVPLWLDYGACVFPEYTVVSILHLVPTQALN